MTTSAYCIHEFDPPKGLPSCDLDPFAEDFLEAPHAGHEQLRNAGPFVWLTQYKVAATAQYETVRKVLLDWETYSSARGVGMEDLQRHANVRLPSVILERDPPEHDTARLVLARALSPRRLKQLKDAVAAKAQRIVDEALTRETIDAASFIAEALPMAVFPDLIGIPRQGRDRLLSHADMLFNSFGPRNALFKASVSGGASAWVEEMGALENLAPDGLGAEIHHIAAEAGHAPDYAAKLVRALLQAGLDTTINGLGAMLYCLSTHPDQWELLKARPDLSEAAFEEAIRLESPVQTFFRTVTRPVEFEDCRLDEGMKVLMFLGAANRDPRQFDAPDEYRITRQTAGHVGFGAGIHHCVGRRLANLEAQALLEALIERVVRIEPAGAPVRRLNNTVRGFASLPIRLVAA